MNLGVYESELSFTRKLLDNKLLECSEKLNKNPNDYQTLTELITISIYSGLNDMMVEAYQQIRTHMWRSKLPNLRVAAYKYSLEKIASAYDTIAL